MLVYAAVCPHPPLLVPDLAGTADEAAEVREASLVAVRRVLTADADQVVVVGSAPVTASWDSSAGGTLSGYGIPVSAGGRELVLPLSLTIGAWLLDRAEALAARPDTVDDQAGALLRDDPKRHPDDSLAARGDSLAVRGDSLAVRGDSLAVRGDSLAARRYVAVDERATPAECARLGAELVAGPERVALLVMGDGSAKLSTSSPGYLDERAVKYDAAALAALQAADAEALLALDAGLGEDLWVAGRPAWQALAGAARATYAHQTSTVITAETLYAGAPFGVGYFVVTWSLHG